MKRRLYKKTWRYLVSFIVIALFLVGQCLTVHAQITTEPGIVPVNLAPPSPIKQALPDTDVTTGALTYSYPFKLPPGRLGIQPQVGLSYNSQNTDEGSLFGYGWTLSIPTIERKNLNGTDKLYTSHDFTSSLDGDLKYVSGSGNSIIFYAKTETGGFNRYELQNESSGGIWTVQTKQGLTYTFGESTESKIDNPNDSTKVFRWYLTTIADQVGNYASFSYSKINSQVYPSSITYTNYGQQAGAFSVQFTLENRPDTAINSRPGFMINITKRIQKVESYIGTNLAGRYSLSYEQAPINNRSRLSAIQFTGYDQLNQSTSEQPTQFTYSSISATGLLTEITQPTGGTTTITYKPATQYRDSNEQLLNPDLPFGIYAVEQLQYNDGNNVVWANTYEYSGGWYYYNSPFDRKFVGFERVVKADADGNRTTSYYHQANGNNTSYGEVGDSPGKEALLYKTEKLDSNSNLLQRVFNTWDAEDIGNGRMFVTLTQTLDQTFDGNTTHKDKAASYTYDSTTGNLSQQIQWGEVTGSSNGKFTDTGTDKFTTDMTYATNGYVMYLIASQLTTDQSSVKVKESRYYYDGMPLGQVSTGLQTKDEEWRSGPKYINSQKTYNSYGLVTIETDPRGKETTYTYDSYDLYPAASTNALNQTTSFSYDYTSGQVTQMIDSNSEIFTTNFDGLDRPISVLQPDPQNPQLSLTKTTFEYVDTPNANRIKKTDYLDASNSLEAYTYLDGFGRIIQERKEADATNQYSTKDYIYEHDNLLFKESLPYFSAGSAKTSATTSTDLYSVYSYDALQRILSVQTVVGTTTYAYDDWKTTITDATSKQKDIYKDSYDNLIEVDENNDISTYTTTYQWNGLQKLIKITDSLDNIRNFTYDGLGRVITSEDLHDPNDLTFGTWSYIYDASGNLVSRTDPNSQVVTYSYDDINRPLTEDYTGTIIVEVSNTYDNCTFGIGRLCYTATDTYNSTNTYNALGQLIEEFKVIEGSKFKTEYSFDRQGNLVTITNPDSSVFQYLYNTAGSVNQIQRKEKGDTFFTDVITSIMYNPLAQPNVIDYANGAVTTNTYDSMELYRLRNKFTVADNQNVQDLSYTYDSVGDITQIVDQSTTQTAKTTDYTYDDLHRLTSATATNAANGDNFAQTYSYNAIGNIVNKSDVGDYDYEGNQGSNYANPHAATTVNGVAYQYDDNGNLTSAGILTQYSWDYNNRLTQASNGLIPDIFAYDSNGQRIKAISSNGTTYYPTKYFSSTNNVAEKHVFFGDEAVATIQGSGEEATIYYIHTDHLNGSNVITNSSQTIDELTDYYPFGSLRIDQQNGTHNEELKFTGHIYDAETSLIYANARYYDTQLGRWISQDPIFIKFTDQKAIETIAGQGYDKFLANPQTFNAYSYVANNPLKYIDPFGLFNSEKGLIEKGDTQKIITDDINSKWNVNYSWSQIVNLNSDVLTSADINLNSLVGKNIIPNIGTPDITLDLTTRMHVFGADEKMSNPAYFLSKVKNKGDLDLKNQKGTAYYKGNDITNYVFNAQKVDKDAPGNILYGYVGSRAGYSNTTLHMGAGYAQIMSGTSRWGWVGSRNFGDDPRDAIYINYGIYLNRTGR